MSRGCNKEDRHQSCSTHLLYKQCFYAVAVVVVVVFKCICLRERLLFEASFIFPGPVWLLHKYEVYREPELCIKLG